MITSHLRGDTAKAHQENVAKLHDYLIAIRADGSGLPAEPSKPFAISFRMVAKEAGVHLWVLNRPKLRCRKLIEDAARDIAINVRRKPRVRSIYTIEEAIAVAVATIQANCEAARVDHRPKCRGAARLMKKIARRRLKGKLDDSLAAVSDAVQKPMYSKEDAALLVEIKDILERATRGELELHTFHGRLKLESALAGFSLSAIAKFTNAACQTVINWGAGLKAPTLSYKSEIPKIEKALQLPEGYLSSVYLSNRSGPSNVKQHFVPDEIKALSPAKQRRFRRLFPTDLDLRQLGERELEQLITEKLAIFHAGEAITIDRRRAMLRSKGMRYGLKKLPPHLQQEFDELVAARTNVRGFDDVEERKRGWDANTIGIYHDRFCRFFGWMHHVLGVPLENLSIASLGFSQVLREYNLYLLTRKARVGMKRRWAESALDWCVFASSLTRRQLGMITETRDCRGDVGWLRGRRALIERLAPIDRLRVSDEIDVKNGERDDVRAILTAADIAEARQNWAMRLDETTAQYRHFRFRMKGNITPADSVRRVQPILELSNPLRAIEHGVWQLNQKIAESKRGKPHWCTAVRDCITVKLLAQVPLRRQTFCGLTYRRDNSGMVFQKNGKWWLKIPVELFKNEKSDAFEEMTRGGFYVVTLEDEWGLYTDLETYTRLAREGILSGVKSDAFYVTRGNPGHVGPKTFGNLFRAFTENYIAENPGRETGLQGVEPFGPHAMRHIVASAVFYRTQSMAAAAAAIHDSEETTRKHYRKYFLDPVKRADLMRTVLGPEADSPIWPKFGEILPSIAAPSTAPQILSSRQEPHVAST